MSIRVLHIITKLELGGAQKHVLSVLAALNERCYERYLVSGPGLLSPDARSLLGKHFFNLPFLTRLPNPVYDFLAFIALIFIIKKNKIQVVHTHSSKAGILGRWAAKFCGVETIIHTIHGWGFHDYRKNLFNDLYIFLEKITARITSKLIVVTEYDKQKGLLFGIGRQEQYVLVRYGAPPGFPVKKRSYLEILRHNIGVGEERVVGMVACLKHQKNPVDFVRAAEFVLKSHPGTKFILVGDGVLRQEVLREIQVRNLCEDVLLLGWRRDVSDILMLCDVVVLTSLWEGFPIVLLEAMSLAKPVVAYDVCGLNELVKDGFNGYLVAPQDISEFSKKVSFLLAHDELRGKIGQLAKLSIAQRIPSISDMVAKIACLYGN